MQPRENASSLELKDAIGLTLTTGTRIDGLWNQYFAFTFGLLAFISSNLASFRLREAAIASLGIAFFAMFNAVALIREYTIISIFVKEASAIAAGSKFASAEVQRLVSPHPFQMSFIGRRTIVALAHFFAAAGIIFLVFREQKVREDIALLAQCSGSWISCIGL
mgnify:CR=1 FL=1